MHRILLLKDQIAHDRRWSERFLQLALASEKACLSWLNAGHNYMALCLEAAKNAQLNDAVIYDTKAHKGEVQLALLEKSM